LNNKLKEYCSPRRGDTSGTGPKTVLEVQNGNEVLKNIKTQYPGSISTKLGTTESMRST
jgi:hypothetical protein